MKQKFVAKSYLAKQLGVSKQVVNNWAKRGLIKRYFNEEVGMELVELITEKPTKGYNTKKNISELKSNTGNDSATLNK